MNYKIAHPTKIVNCAISLPASKSISNRLLIIQALCKEKFQINNLSKSDDTKKLQQALKNKSKIINIGASGSAFRFLTSYLANKKNKEYLLTGTNRIKERPIKELIEALRKLGGEIDYTEKINLAPIKIKGKELTGNKVTINGSISSQFISSLLMIAPTLKKGLEINIKGNIVSKPYIKMTLEIMKEYGIHYIWKRNTIKISHQTYIPKAYTVESDWSAAAFWFEIASLSSKCKIILNGLYQNSLQGDIAVRDLFSLLGVSSKFEDNCLILEKKEPANNINPINLINTPDLYQPLQCALFGLNQKVKIKGLKTLKNKETNRLLAVNKEIKNINNVINTYKDHRMAMSFSPLALIFKHVIIKDVKVVSKSYINFWNDLKKGGFIISPSTY